MPTPAEFLKSLGDDLARYDRDRVARIGCFTALGLLAVGIAAGIAGIRSPHPIFPGFLRFLMALMLGGVVILFVIFALAETLAERRAMGAIRAYLSDGRADLATLLEMARARKGRFPGSDKVIGILERGSGGTGTAS